VHKGGKNTSGEETVLKTSRNTSIKRRQSGARSLNGVLHPTRWKSINPICEGERKTPRWALKRGNRSGAGESITKKKVGSNERSGTRRKRVGPKKLKAGTSELGNCPVPAVSKTQAGSGERFPPASKRVGAKTLGPDRLRGVHDQKHGRRKRSPDSKKIKRKLRGAGGSLGDETVCGPHGLNRMKNKTSKLSLSNPESNTGEGRGALDSHPCEKKNTKAETGVGGGPHPTITLVGSPGPTGCRRQTNTRPPQKKQLASPNTPEHHAWTR